MKALILASRVYEVTENFNAGVGVHQESSL